MKDIKTFIRQVITENADELSSTKATSFLNVVELYLPDKANFYKTIIYKRSLKDAILEFPREMKKEPEAVDKVVSKGFFNKTGNPLGISGKDKNYKTSNELSPEPIDLATYVDKANELKKNPGLKPADLPTLNRFFTPQVFDMINKAIMRLTERHNKQIEEAGANNLEVLIDPYTGAPIDLNDPTVVNRLGAYYQNESSYTKSHQLHDANRIIQTALNKGTISGLRWLYNNAKNIG